MDARAAGGLLILAMLILGAWAAVVLLLWAVRALWG